MRFASLVIPICLVLSGCLGGLDDAAPIGPGDAFPLDVEAFALPLLEQDHEHHVEPEAHAGHIGFTPAQFLPARTGAYPKGEVYFEMAVKGGYAYLSFGSKLNGLPPSTILLDSEAGFIVYDVRRPTTPKEVARWIAQPLSDIEVTDDGAYAFASTQRNGYPYPYTINPLDGPTGEIPRGTYIVDVRDKAKPNTIGFEPLPTNGPHTITYYQMPNGRELLIHCTYDVLFTQYPQNLGQALLTQKVVISEFVRTPAPALRPLSVFQLLVPDEGTVRQHFPHDATVHVDPATDRVILDVAYWDLGLVTVDITDPMQPEELDRFADTGPSKYTKTHLVRVFPGTIDGRVVAVLEPEIPTGEDAGQYTFVDVTNPADIRRLGYWGLPGEHKVDFPFVFSPHNFDLVCGGQGQVTGRLVDYGRACERPTVVASHFHGGLWALDASDPTRPRATGYFFPLVERTNVDAGFPFTGFVTTFVENGYAFAPEAWTGLHVLRLPGGPESLPAVPARSP